MWRRDLACRGQVPPRPQGLPSLGVVFLAALRTVLPQRAHYIGTVEAPGMSGRREAPRDERSAEAATIAQFELNEEQRKRPQTAQYSETKVKNSTSPTGLAT